MASICQWRGRWGTATMRSPAFLTRHLFAACFSIRAFALSHAYILTIYRLAQVSKDVLSSRNHTPLALQAEND